MKKFNKKTLIVAFFAVITFSLASLNNTYAATSPTLTGAASYSVLGASTVTNTGSTTTTGDVGVTPGTAITGFPPGVASGNNSTHLHSNDASAIAAQADDLTTFGALDQGCDQSYPSGQDLTLLSPLIPGVYCSAGSFLLSGNLTLSGSGVWIFKAASALTTSTGSSITGGDPCNVWWQIGSSATLGTTTSFIGNILALTSITLNTNASLDGRVLVQTGAITLDSNIITRPTCTTTTTTGGTTGGGTTTTAVTKPTPGLPNTGYAPIKDTNSIIWTTCIVIAAITVSLFPSL
jgi:hypothetical protein